MPENTLSQQSQPASSRTAGARPDEAPAGRELVVRLDLRWGDMDAYGHVNNVQFVRLLEEARVRLLGSPTKSMTAGPDDDVAVQLFSRAGSDTSSVVAKQTVEYLAQLEYRTAPIAVFLAVSRIGGASFDIAYSIAEPDKSTTYVRAETTVVFVRRDSGRPRRITADEREILNGLLVDPVQFRR
ncbi:acyl-CoA thioesterase [Spelaeicoccus albus]|uniref:acyl-CoA thioesterase n=1 Tax=Spelaeicoccus albus TaxID=1280376 RepID=UPI0015CB3493|nr:thioesterase family protein [Spelaeicoccus albus]